MPNYSKLEKFLRHRDFILCVAIASVIWLTPNTYFVYFSFMEKHFASPWMEIAAGGVSLIVASGILIYTLRGNMRVANYYMWFEISISSFYYITTIGWDWALIPAFSFVFMLPISLKHYTVELNKDKGEDFNGGNNNLDEELRVELARLQCVNNEYAATVGNNIERIEALQGRLAADGDYIDRLRDELETRTGERDILDRNNIALKEKINELTPPSGRIPGLNNMSEADLISMAKNAEKDTFTPSPDLY
jgi:hypothetical protein